MKKLYLIRHAKSSWADADILSDIERPLNERGKRDAPFMGKILEKKGIRPDALVSSPATRAFKTAKLIGEALSFAKKDIAIRPAIYEAEPETILEVIQGFDNQWDTVFIFGHNPTFTEVANWYAQPSIDNLPTCGIVGLVFEVNHWREINPENGTVIDFEYPKKYLPGIADD